MISLQSCRIIYIVIMMHLQRATAAGNATIAVNATVADNANGADPLHPGWIALICVVGVGFLFCVAPWISDHMPKKKIVQETVQIGPRSN
jgi:hypothetical protein